MMSAMSPMGPLPPVELAGYILGQEGSQEALRLYETQGAEILDGMLRCLGPDWSWEGRRVLDFGCGAGRVLRRLAPFAAELHGCDIDAACVAWLQEALCPPLHVLRSNPDPPLPYPDGHFDLIYAIAVFPHLDRNWAPWLLELRRLLAPDGRLLVSLMAAGSSEALTGEPWDPERVGMTVLGPGRPWHAGGPMILHSPWWVRAHYGRAFRVLAHAPAAICGQDAYLLAARESTPEPAELAAPEPDEPRELTAALYALELLQRDYAKLNAAHDAYAAAYRTESELRSAAEARLAAPPPGLARRLRRRRV